MNQEHLSKHYADILATYSQLVNAIDQEKEDILFPLLKQLKTQIDERLNTKKS